MKRSGIKTKQVLKSGWWTWCL